MDKYTYSIHLLVYIATIMAIHACLNHSDQTATLTRDLAITSLNTHGAM